jgi:hypothetical protein
VRAATGITRRHFYRTAEYHMQTASGGVAAPEINFEHALRQFSYFVVMHCYCHLKFIACLWLTK